MQPECDGGQAGIREPYAHFSLTLMVNHACNLRCTYCYTGAKFQHPMPLKIGQTAIRRAFASTVRGGELELGFFGGEPLLEAECILQWVHYAQKLAALEHTHLYFNLTTNGTQLDARAWEVMLVPELRLAISCDGTPSTHDRHRLLANGRGSSSIVESTLRQLRNAGKEFKVVMVVRPDTVPQLAENLGYLHYLGVRQVDLSLDLWTTWTREAVAGLEAAIPLACEVWQRALPDFAVNWFDEKVARIARVPLAGHASCCGFGAGEIAVAPSGRLYPCERLIGEDREINPVRLPGEVHGGRDFLALEPARARSSPACSSCAIQSLCNTTCRCSNYIRTGDVARPDGLLCRLDKACYLAVARLFQILPATTTQSERCSHGLIQSHATTV